MAVLSGVLFWLLVTTASSLLPSTKTTTSSCVQARGLSSAMSAASSACDHIRDWLLGTPEGTFVSMAVFSDGSYNTPKGVMYSFPVTCKDGKWSIVQGLPIDEFSAAKMKLTGDELVEEKELALECLKE